MFYSIDPALRRKLKVLCNAGDRARNTRAAMALWAWYGETGPGHLIRASRTRHRHHNHISRSKILPNFEVMAPAGMNPTMKALIFTDRSTLVMLDRKDTPDTIEVLPMIFQLDDNPVDPMLRLRADNRGSYNHLAPIVLIPPGTERPDWDKRQSYSESQVSEDDALWHHPALEALRRDLGHLRPLFDEPSWIAQPTDGPLPEGKLDAQEQSRLRLPIEASGGQVSWVQGLPFLLTRQEEKREAHRYMEDLLSYVGHVYRDQLSLLCFVIQLSRDRFEEPIIMMMGRKETTPQSTGFSIEHILEDPARCPLPIPKERMRGMSFHDMGRIKQETRRTELCRGTARELSNHEALALRDRFGPLREGLFT